MKSVDLILLITGLLLSLMTFSYIFGQKLLFGIAMVAMLGIISGFAALVLIQKVLFPMTILPLFDFPQVSALLALVPIILAGLLIWSLFYKSSKFSGFPLALIVGFSSAVLIFGLSRGTLAPQLLSLVNAFSLSNLNHEGLPNWAGIIEAFMMLAGVLAVLFFFHHRKSEGYGQNQGLAWLEGLSAFGQVFIGISFGAVFVGLFGSGLVALIAWLQSLVDFVRLWI